MYGSSELNVIPEFQRLFRWTDDRKSNFVESILIGIPIPPAFVYENENGTWELIDGLQRISTILEFMGVLRDPDTNELKRSKLIAAKYLPSLSNVVWKAQSENENSLDTALQLFFRRHRIDFQILKHPSDPNTKFDLFQRLNRGGAYANEQEVRTCSMVLANPVLTKKIRETCTTAEFRSLFKITEEQRKNQQDMDFATRVLVHTMRDLPKRLDVQAFLDRSIIDVLSGPDAEQALETLTWAITAIHKALGDDALIPPDERADGIAPRFSLRALEGIVVGIARNRKEIEPMRSAEKFISRRISAFWKQSQVADMSAAGLRGTVRLQRSIPFGTDWFKPNGKR